MKKKKVISLLLATAMIASMAAGCGGNEGSGNSGSGGSGEEEVTLTVLAGQSTTDAGIEDMIDEALAEKYPEITLEWECVDWGNDFQPKMQQYMQSGLPDIMIGKAQDVATYAPQGVLGEIDDTYLDRGLDAARENVTIDGKTYGLVYNAMYQGVYYNKTMFDSLDIAEPKTWTDIENASKKIYEAYGIPVFGIFPCREVVPAPSRLLVRVQIRRRIFERTVLHEFRI